MRRRVFLSGAILTGVGLPLLTGCKAPWQSKRQTGSTSASVGGAAGTSAAPQGWQQLDGHIAGHHIIVNVSPIIRKDESTSILALELFRASDDKNRTESKPTSSTPDNKFTIVDYLGKPSKPPTRERRLGCQNHGLADWTRMELHQWK